MSSARPAARWIRAASAFSNTPVGIGAARATRFTPRRTLHTGADLLTDKQHQRLTDLFATDAHVEVEVTWSIYQRMTGAYRAPDYSRGRS